MSAGVPFYWPNREERERGIITFPIFETRAVTMAKGGLLDRLLGVIDAGVASFARLLDSLAVAIVLHEEKRHLNILKEMSNQIAGVLILSDFWGRAAIARKARAAGVPEPPAPVYLGGGPPSGPPPDEPQDEFEYPEGPREIRVQVLEDLAEELPAIPNREAIADIVSREPRLVESVAEGGPKWLQVARMYAEEHAFALAKSSDITVTKRVQAFVHQVLEEGGTVDSAALRIAEIGGFNRAYSETVFRTNAASAFTSGAFRQVRDPETNYAFPAFEFSAVHDASTRPNHAAADGMIAATDDAVWGVWAPPLGYNCRCAMRLVSRDELERRGLLVGDKVRPYYPAGIRTHSPDPGFGQGTVLTRFQAVPI